MKVSRRIAAMGAAGMMAVAGVGSAAWACYGETDGGAPYLHAPEPNEAPAGSTVLVSGGNFAPNQRVEVSLSSDGRSPTRGLGSAPTDGKGSFLLRTQVPEVTPGMWWMLSTQASVAKAVAFEVTSATATPTPTTEQEQTPGSTSSAGSATLDDGQAAPATRTPRRSTASVANTEAAPVAEQAQTPVANVAGQPATASPAGTNTARLNQDTPASATRSATPAAPGPIATATEAANSASAAAAAGSAADDDLWVGFDGKSPLEAPGLDDLDRPSDPAAPLPGLVGAAVVALALGFGVSEARRRRVGAASGHVE